jgi:hypothetical protein
MRMLSQVKTDVQLQNLPWKGRYVSQDGEELKAWSRTAVVTQLKEQLAHFPYPSQEVTVRRCAFVTGTIRTDWAKLERGEGDGKRGTYEEQRQDAQSMRDLMTDVFGQQEHMWNAPNVAVGDVPEGADANYFLPHNVEGDFELAAVQAMYKSMEQAHLPEGLPEHTRPIASLGMGRGSSQFTFESNGEFRHIEHSGMNLPNRLMRMPRKFTDHMGDPNNATDFAGLVAEVKKIRYPVIALKSGCLILLAKLPSLLQRLTIAVPAPPVVPITNRMFLLLNSAGESKRGVSFEVALSSLLSALCYLLSVLCSLFSALCSLLSILCTLFSVLC